MTKRDTPTLAYLVCASLFSLAIAYIFGNDGYEAFATTAIALGLLLSWQLINIARLLFRSNIWLIVKFVGALMLGFFWFVAIATVISSVSSNTFSPQIPTPNVNWIVVSIGTLPFLLPRLGLYRSSTAIKTPAIGALVSLYSIMVLYIAIIGYHDSNVTYRGLLLVIAVQIQYLMSYTVIKTDYLERSHAFATNLSHRLKITGSDIGDYIHILVVGLPFLLPLGIIALVSTLS